MAAQISPDDVAYIATLSRLAVTDEERERFSEQLSSVLEHVDAIRRLDITGVEPTSHPLELVNVLRDDVVVAPLGADAVLAGAPAAEAQRFKVPPILGDAPEES